MYVKVNRHDGVTGYNPVVIFGEVKGPWIRADAFSRDEMKGYAGFGRTGVKLVAPFGVNWGASCPTGIAPAPEEKAG